LPAAIEDADPLKCQGAGCGVMSLASGSLLGIVGTCPEGMADGFAGPFHEGLEVGAGLVPGGGPMARLPRLIGRGRALEVLLGADDIGGDVAELYGYVNRALPDAELDAFVDALATRISSFDKHAIAETKHLVNLNSLPPDAEIALEWDAFIASLGRPAAQARIRTLFEHGFHQSGDVETRLGYHVGLLDFLSRSE
jgi:hypothetical protein